MPQKCKNKLKPNEIGVNITISVTFNTENLDALKRYA